MLKTLGKYKDVARVAIPALLAISIVEVVNIQMYLSAPLAQGGALVLFLWVTLQMIPGFLFGYISDKHFRKATLIICQILGLVGGLILWVFGFETWVFILIALTFNPIPVARAALLDHFPKHSTVKLVSITFFAQYFPWVMYSYIAGIEFSSVLKFVLFVLALNTLLTIFLFKGDVAKPEEAQPKSEGKIQLFRKNLPLTFTLVAFIFAEAAFYLLWAFLENDPNGHKILSVTNMGTILGIGIAMLYTKVHHMSIITLFYSVGAAATFIAFTHCFSSSIACFDNLTSSMSFYCIIGGMYLPFVTDGVIKMLGAKHRALGSAFIELGSTVAVFFAPVLNILYQQNSYNILLTIVIFLFLAAFFQKVVEKRIVFR